MQALWMVLAAFLFASMGVCVKTASAFFNTAELVCYRGLVSMALLWALARAQGMPLVTRYPGMHAWRSLLGVTSLSAWFYAVAYLPLAGGDLDQALIWTEWTQDFNASVLSPARSNYYRCLQTLLLLAQEPEREAAQYYTAFVKMYGQEAVDAASAAISGEERFNGLFAVDADLKALPAHQALLAAYEKLQAAKRRHWAKA